MTFEELIKRKIISRSIAELLLNDEEEVDEDLFPHVFPYKAFNIGLLYTALVQAYTLGLAIKKGVTLRELNGVGYPRSIRDFWHSDGNANPYRSGSHEGKMWVFSFLNECTKCTDKNVFDGKAEMIAKAQTAVEKTKNTGNRVYLDSAGFEGLICALPLLRVTEMDWQKMCFVFHTENEGSFEMDCRPFLFFGDEELETLSNVRTPYCHVMSSIENGERHGQFFVNTYLLNDLDFEFSLKPIRWQVARNETLRMILKTLEISEEWLSVEECWCDFAFMKRLADAAEKVFEEYWGLDEMARIGSDIRERLCDIFSEEGIRASVANIRKASGEKLLLENMEKVLFGLYINHGIFKTMYSIFHFPTVEKNDGKKLFTLFLDKFEENAVLAASEKKSYLNECEQNIKQHLDALREKVAYSESPTSSYQIRSKEIEAEWRAFTILKAAGIRNDNLFIDREAIYSIDDYYDRIGNVNTDSQTLLRDLSDVLSLLICTYAPILTNKTSNSQTRGGKEYMRLDEEQYYRESKQLKKEIAQDSVEQLFERFIGVVEQSEDHPIIQGILGRKNICSERWLKALKDRILKKKDEAQEAKSDRVEDVKRYVFISYAHRDNEGKADEERKSYEGPITQAVKEWKEKGFGVRFDDFEFAAGDNWIEKARAFIRDERCAGVVLFMSRKAAVSNAVLEEMKAAVDHANKKFGKGTERARRFLIPVNLEEENISTYLDEINLDENETEENTRTARKMLTILHDDKLAFPYPQAKDRLEESIANLLKEPIKEEKATRVNSYSPLELAIANFYLFVKYGQDNQEKEKKSTLDQAFHGTGERKPSLDRCVFPIVASMKEARIHRDNVTLVGYEMIRDRGERNTQTNYILTSKPLLSPDDYYCIPHYDRVGEDCSWMVDPLLISHKKMMDKGQ